MNDFGEIVQLSREIGQEIPFWTQGPGGNVSVKFGDHLWVKSSGFDLKDVSETSGLTCVPTQEFNAKLSVLFKSNSETLDVDYGALVKNYATSTGRPSMEVAFHAFMPKRFVLHFHALSSFLIAHKAKISGPQFISWFTKNSPFASYKFLEVTQPGAELAKKLISFRDVDVVFLTNHGVVLQGDEGRVLMDLWREFEKKFIQCFYPQLGDYQKWNLPRHLEFWSANAVPVKIFSPDTAVFLERIMKVLTLDSGVEKRYHLNRETAAKDSVGTQIWIANAVLWSVEPNLNELDSEFQNVTQNMPLEKFRQGKS